MRKAMLILLVVRGERKVLQSLPKPHIPIWHCILKPHLFPIQHCFLKTALQRSYTFNHVLKFQFRTSPEAKKFFGFYNNSKGSECDIQEKILSRQGKFKRAVLTCNRWRDVMEYGDSKNNYYNYSSFSIQKKTNIYTIPSILLQERKETIFSVNVRFVTRQQTELKA